MANTEATLSDRPTPGERRGRWLAALSLLLLVPAAMAVVGWSDAVELRRKLEWNAIDVAAGQRIEFNGARIALAALDVLPSTTGLPADRTFARLRLDVEASGPASQDWLDCRIFLVDSQGRRWEAINFAPTALERQFKKPGESAASRCSTLAVGTHQAGTKLVIDAYFLVPRDATSSLRPTLSAMGARPDYLRFTPETKP
ncbi:hypothetical protein [Reyranella sp.]|uniref:hypothetical protein n=1 Tax=Reyranella sp. TaxID=1929291 RepID=UPI0011FBDEA7|nr:hypothetical protein [Reyranella sp.]TAJ87637.1 MAG: hypothetical protein EPO50_11690 [Reyranella sp.]